MPEQSGPFRITVLGRVGASFELATNRGELSPGKQRTLALLVAAGQRGVLSSVLADEENEKPDASARMAIARLRKHLPAGVIPPATDGRYLLQLPRSDVDVWPLLSIKDSEDICEIAEESLVHWLTPDLALDRFGGVAIVNEAATEIRAAQRLLLRLVAEHRPEVLGERLVDVVRSHLDSDPYNELLLSLAAKTLTDAGRRLEAIRFLSNARQEFLRAGVSMSPDLEAVHHALLDGALDGEIAQSSIVGNADLPAVLADQTLTGWVGSRDAVERVVESMGSPSRAPISALVLGESGSGKTRACAEIAAEASKRGFAVRYCSPSTPDGDAALGPFIRLLPDLRDEVETVLRGSDDAESRTARIWIALSNSLDNEAAGRPLLLIVDDAQWLDTYSAAAVTHLLDSVPDHKLMLVIAARAEHLDSPWPTLEADLKRRGTLAIKLGSLDVPALRELVKSRRPVFSPQVVSGVADELARTSRGLPGVAVHLIDSLDSDGFVPPVSGTDASSEVLAPVLAGLSPTVRKVAMLGSVAATDFSTRDLTRLGGGDVPVRVMMDAVKELAGRRLFVQVSTDRFVVAHALVQSAAIAASSWTEVADAHLRAAKLFTGDVHRLAHHEAAAVPLISPDIAATSLLASATALLGDGLYREAARRYGSAQELSSDGNLSAADAANFARALHLSGARYSAVRVRGDSFDRAESAGLYAEALTIAVSGLPEAEPVDGDPFLVELLLRVDPSRLTRDDRWRHANHLARQLAVVGRLGEAREWAERSLALAGSSEERLAASICRRFSISATSTPQERIAILEPREQDLADLLPSARAEYLLLSAIDQYESGDHELAKSTIGKLRSLGVDLPPRRRWHLMMFEAMVAADGLDIAEARVIRAAARDFALSCGFAEFDNAHQAADFVDLWIGRSTAFLADEVSGGVLDPSNSVIARAGVAIVLAEIGDLAQATAHAEVVAESVLASPVAQGIAALALVSAPLGHSHRNDLVAASRALLTQRGDSMVIIAAAAASLGPVARYIAPLSPDDDERAESLWSAKRLADASGAPLWRLVVLRDLLDHADHSDLRDEFRTLTSELSAEASATWAF